MRALVVQREWGRVEFVRKSESLHCIVLGIVLRPLTTCNQLKTLPQLPEFREL